MSKLIRPAPPWQVAQWFNTSAPPSLEALRGKVIVLEAFQMLCPGCVSHGLPQATRVREAFSPDEVAVVGLHTVFEHHAAMTATSLQAFLHEYRIAFPVGIDRSGIGSAIPQTMQAYQMRGTPTLVLIDARGLIRYQHFGQVGDLLLGAQIASLLGEAAAIAGPEAPAADRDAEGACDDGACAIQRQGPR